MGQQRFDHGSAGSRFITILNFCCFGNFNVVGFTMRIFSDLMVDLPSHLDMKSRESDHLVSCIPQGHIHEICRLISDECIKVRVPNYFLVFVESVCVSEATPI